MSEPKESSPSGCPGDGPGTEDGVTWSIHSLVAGSYGVSNGANSATSTSSATRVAPMIAAGFRRSRRNAPRQRLVPRSSSPPEEGSRSSSSIGPCIASRAVISSPGPQSGVDDAVRQVDHEVDHGVDDG